MLWKEFKTWMDDRTMTQAAFCRMVGTVPNQVAIWRTKGHTPKWTSAYIKLWDDHQALLEKVHPTPPPAPPKTPLLVKGVQISEAAPTAPLIAGLPPLRGMAASVAEATPIRQKIISQQTSSGWWVKVCKPWA